MNSRFVRNALITAVLLVIIIGGAYVLTRDKNTENAEQKTDTSVVITDKEEKKEEIFNTVEVVKFGTWVPTKERSLLGQIESQGDTVLPAQLSGTVKNVYVDLGDKVSRGQVLAEFDRTNDQTQVAYQNAVLNLETTKLSVQNSIASAEEQLRSARRSLEQSKNLEATRADQNYETLVTAALSSETAINQSLEWADRLLGVSVQYRNIIDPKSRQIGEGHKILKQNTVNQLENLLRQRVLWRDISVSASKSEKISFANNRLEFLREMRLLLSRIDELIRIAPTDRNFSDGDRAVFLQRVEGYSSSIDGNIAQLEQSLKSAQTSSQASNSTLVGSQNAILQATAALDLAKAQGQSSIQAAENQVAQSLASVDDLTIRSPFSGEITEVMVQIYQTVNPGTPLFSVLSEGTDPKVVLNVTAEELARIKAAEGVMVTFENKLTRFVEQARLSTKVNTQNQKIEVEFILPELPEGVLVGEIVSVNVPVSSENAILLPLSALSFEPGGAEVIVVENNTAVRKVVQVGNLLGDGIEIVNGLEPDDLVVQYRNRVTSGESVKPLE